MNKINYKKIFNISNINLNYHVLIEASAGTGKTYTIENLVLRLLIENENLNLKNILIVTFTEKATNELKIRIRKKLIDKVNDTTTLGNSITKKINYALDHFDEASIFTIHGFCNLILKDYALEIGTLFHKNLVDEIDIFEKLIKDQMRNIWPNLYSNKLDKILTMSMFDGHEFGFISQIVDLAVSKLNNESNQIIIPNCKEVDIKRILRSIISGLEDLKNIIGSDNKFSNQFSKLNINSRSKKALLRDIIFPIEKALQNFDFKNPNFVKLLPLIKLFKKAAKNHKISLHEKLIPKKWLKSGKNIEVCPNLFDIANKITELVEYFSSISNVLIISSANKLLRDVKATKLKNGLLSYKDMLETVEHFLYSKKASYVIDRLRCKYKVAFVDEFQDTDYSQWRIFKKLFIDSNDVYENIILLIGDPKQAIYAFRGADIFTYFEARKEIEKLAINGLANLYQLEKNWRAIPELQNVFNSLFSSKYWFQDIENADFFNITYNPVISPSESEMVKFFSDDREKNHHSFNVIDLTEIDSFKFSKQFLYEFISKEINILVNNPKIKVLKKSKERMLNYNDICILVRNDNDFKSIEPILTKNKVPYSYYKKQGLFQSNEANHLSLIFHAILDPTNVSIMKVVLISPFFDVSLETVATYKDFVYYHSIIALIKKWSNYAKKKYWSKLFQSIMIDSGFTSRHLNDSNWNRVETNLNQIFEYLEVVANNKRLVFPEIVRILDKNRFFLLNNLGDDNIYQIDSEKKQVQVMTMHASKGLEFLVVFIAGGLTSHGDNSATTYHIYDEKRELNNYKLIKDLTGKSGREQHFIEKEDEDKRLFYVAMTRAIFKLYVPYYPTNKKIPWIGPICRFFSDSIDDKLKNCLNNGMDIYWHVINSIECKIENNSIKQLELSTGNNFEESFINHNSIEFEDFRKRIIFTNSFSSMNRVKKKYNNFQPESKFLNNSKIEYTTFSLPSNIKIGSMLHDILERISFSIVFNNPDKILMILETKSIIEKFMRVYEVEKSWLGSVAQVIVNTLTAPIEIDNEIFFLGQLSRKYRRHEVEFYFPINLKKQFSITNCEFEKNSGETLMHGFIDMLFTFKGKVYVVDWKSNKLDGDYTSLSLEANIKQSKYDIQYKIYTLATLKWLKQIYGNLFDPKIQFGGVFFFYLRGMSIGKQSGIYYVPYKKTDDILTLKMDIKNLV